MAKDKAAKAPKAAKPVEATPPALEQCIGCDAVMQPGDVAAYAIMNVDDFTALNVKWLASYIGQGRFVAAPVCAACNINPESRTRRLKAHFSRPDQVRRMTELAGSSTIGG